eukprot:1608064-Pyramimonas_sp.AAC.1
MDDTQWMTHNGRHTMDDTQSMTHNRCGLWVGGCTDATATVGCPATGDNGVGFTYNMTEENLLPFYTRVIGETDLRVLVYNGDTDPGLNSFAAENWTSFLGARGNPP